MRLNDLRSRVKNVFVAAAALLLGVGVAGAQQQVNLTAGAFPATTMPDGTTVPMWGYTCTPLASGVTSTATCAALHSGAAGWSPVVITVPTGQDLQINLTNNLKFLNGNSVPTSLVIVGQLGGGLGTTATSAPSPDHSSAQTTVTWPTVVPGTGTGPAPTQANRVQSFSTEVAAGATAALTWTAPRPGTYLIESGTHPSIQGSMGLYGILVVTDATNGIAYGKGTAAITYQADVPLLFSEIDPVQNKAVSAAVNTAGFSETKVWSGQPSGCGNPASSTYHTCYPPVVNYSPLYYMINGVAFDKTNAGASLFAASSAGTATTPVAGTVLVRMVNAGSRMHVPAIVGSQTQQLATGTAATVGGFSLIAEDGNPLPGVARVQNEVFMAAGKTYDVMINAPASGASALPVYDRQLSLSGNATSRDAGMLAYIGVNGGVLPSAPALGTAAANPDVYNSVVPGETLTVSDPGKGVIANDVNIYGVKVLGTAPTGLTLNTDGTFTYTAGVATTFTYCGNGATSGSACALVTLAAAAIENGSLITLPNCTYTSTVATYLKIGSPGVLACNGALPAKDAAGYPLTVATSTVTSSSGLTVVPDPKGGFNATVTSPGTYTFTYKAQNSQGTVSTAAATVTLIFPLPSNLAVTVKDGADKTTVIKDYRWIIEEDRTFYVDPNCTTNPLPAGCPTVNSAGAPAVFGTNFHTSHMPVVAAGCTGSLSCEDGQKVLGVGSVCDVGNGACRPGPGQTRVDPKQVALDKTKRYYISIFPGDAAQPFINAYGGAPNCSSTAGVSTPSTTCGHGMGGAPIATNLNNGGTVTVLTEPSPFPPATLSVFVFEDDYPLNGEHDAGGGIDILSPDEPGLGGFQITLQDNAGGTGDSTGTPTYDMFNMPLSNALAGTIDPITGVDACPINAQGDGITSMIVTCPKYEADGVTLSPMAGQAKVANLYPGRYGVVANPGADRIGRGEEWLQTNTLDGQKAHDSFMRVGEPGYFQEFGPGGYHVTIGFANPKVINDRKAALCPTGTPCSNEVKGHVTTARMSRTPDERLYGSGNHDSYAFTQCYGSIGDPDGADFAFVKCDADGNFDFTGLPAGNFKLTLFDQWNDQVVDGISTPVGLAGQTGTVLDLHEVAVHQWQADFFTRTFLDINGDGVSTKDSTGVACAATNPAPGCNANFGNDTEPGLALVKTNVRFRDGSFSNRNNTDLNGYAGFNEEFPLFNWYVIETDNTRYKNTGTHIVYDAGGPTDNAGGGKSTIAANYANTVEQVSVPVALRVPGARYCKSADCPANDPGFDPTVAGSGSTGRIDPPWVETEGWQGFSGQNNFLEFGKKPYAAATPAVPATLTTAAIPAAPAENGGITGHVIYSSTRPFDDPQFNTQNVWEPLVPGVTINLYKEGTAPDGSQSLTLVDTTTTSSFDDWAQGFRSDGVPNMNCPGQTTTDPFYFGLQGQPNYLDWYNSQHGGPAVTTLPNNSQFKCYDGMHNWNQLQPAPYDGMYKFPSVTGLNPTTGKPAGTNCTACIANPTSATVDPTDPLYDPYRAGTPMLPSGKYVVEVVPPPGYELVKEEDKNILIGDNYIAPVTTQFAGLGNIFILPDQAEVASACNATSSFQDPTCSLGRAQSLTSHEGDTPTVDTFWPCVGASRTVPDFISLFPQSKQVAPFAGATRNLCDRKEVTLDDQTSLQAEFFLWTPTHIASKFTGVITDDFDAEFDPFSPQFGEKFAPAYLPVSVKDWAGNETARVYTDEWGIYNGLSYSTWEVNPPNPTGYAPTMMVMCMNDPGTGTTPDPKFQPGYSNFCYELPFMPGATGYFDTPVVPTSAFAGGYNHPDCAYPDATPAIASVVSNEIAGPWASGAGTSHTLTITSLTATADQSVENYGYSGPGATTSPFNQQKITRHYGFGSQCTSPVAGNATCNTLSSVTIGGVSAPVTSWADGLITVTVPKGVPNCSVQQQAQYENLNGVPTLPSALCGELVITAGNGKQSIDTVTVTIGGKKPTVMTAGTIQSAIDTASPGDMIIVPPGTYNEMLIMWKPVRLQGVGAASTVIDANPHPAGRLDPWRRQIVCLFGLAINGTPSTGNVTTLPDGTVVPGTGGTNPYDPSGAFTCSKDMHFSVDRLPLEATVGWTATLNGNLAEQLIEPSLMGAYEGAGITVLAKGVKFNTSDPAIIWASDVYPAGTELLRQADCYTNAKQTVESSLFPSNFLCNPSRIDGLSVVNSSQGGGGIMVHGWGHNIEIANNRIHSNQGTLSGGITVGQGEHPDLSLAGVVPTTIPGSCESDPLGTIPRGSGQVLNQGLPFCYDMYVNMHNNAVTLNSSLGDELFSSTPAGAGGATMCNGSDYYKFNYNWVCGNMSTGDGAGVAHLGYTKNGDIEHNSILFNQSTNPSITTNGGGLLVMGAPDQDPPCALTTDQDCLSAPNTISPSDGTGPDLVINANLIMGNSADAGSGGGLRLQHINGTDVLNFPKGATACKTPGSASCLWNSVTVTNNIITNNVAGWDGGGISLQDALAVNIINNTISSNDSTASAGPLFGSLFAPLASTPVDPNSPGVNCSTSGPNALEQSCPQIAGLVSVTNSAVLVANLPTGGITCPPGHGINGSSTIPSTCAKYSVPLMANNVIWQNRSFVLGVGGSTGGGGGDTTQQKLIQLYNSAFDGASATALAATQTATGTCPTATPSSYWDIGVRGDTGPGNHLGGTLAPTYSVLSSPATANYDATNRLSNAALISEYCNGSRVPPEAGTMEYIVTPGTNETNALPTPVFTLTPSGTVDEGNNWVNLRWGPLAMTNPVTLATLGNYGPTSTSSVINLTPSTANGATGAYTLAPLVDFFGNQRKTNNFVDAGAVEFVAPAATAIASVTGGPLTFTAVVGTTSTAQTLTVHNTGTANLTGITVVVTAPFTRAGGTCGATLTPAAATCTITVVFTPTNTTPATGTVTITGNVPVTGSPVALSGTGVAAVAVASVTGGPLAFGNVPTGTTSTSQTLTLHNTGTASLTGINLTFSSPRYTRPAGAAGGTCGATLTVATGTCTITVVFSPTALGLVNATLAITGNVAVTGSPVALSGTGVAAVVSAILTPTAQAFGTVTRGATAGILCLGGTGVCHNFTLTNTGNVPLTGILSPTITLDGTNYFIIPGLTTCGTVNPIPGLRVTTLAPGATCTVEAQFRPPTTDAANSAQAGTLSVSDLAGTQTSSLTGTAQ